MEYSQVGRITGTHGLDGGVILQHQFMDKSKRFPWKHIFIELHRRSYIPFFIEDRKVLNDEEVRLRLEEVTSKEMARELSGKAVYIETEVFQELFPQTVTPNMEGFTIIDQQLGTIGTVLQLVETPGQVLAVVQYKGKEALIPLIDATLRRVDGLRKTIEVQLPDGLLDVYTD